MPRRVGYNTVAFNDAPYARSGYYGVSGSQAVSFHVTNLVGDSQSVVWDVLTGAAVAADQVLSWDDLQFATQACGLEFDVTRLLTDDQTFSYDVTNPMNRSQMAAWEIALTDADDGHAPLSAVGVSGVLTQIGKASSLTRCVTSLCEG